MGGWFHPFTVHDLQRSHWVMLRRKMLLQLLQMLSFKVTREQGVGEMMLQFKLEGFVCQSEG